MPRSRTGRALTLAVGLALTLFNRLALRLRLRRRVDGWRRAVGLVFRSEATTFVLSAFGLDLWSDAETRQPGLSAAQDHLRRRLHEFLCREPCMHVGIRRGVHEDRPIVCGVPSYTLRLEPFVHGPARFVSPVDWDGEDSRPGLDAGASRPLANVVCRVNADGQADLWIRVNHIAADGVPVQEMLTRLEAAWGVRQALSYPSTRAFAPLSVPRICPGRPDLAEVQIFLDFAPFLDWRKKENARLPESMTVAAGFLWALARHPAFAGIRFGTTVDVPPTGGLGRSVGMIMIRPADYLGRPDGLAEYVGDFNRELELTRRRAGAGWELLDAIGLLPGRLAGAVLGYALEQAPTRATLVLTIVKDARVFGAPVSEVGSANGVIALGRLDLPREGGGSVGCVTIKGPVQKIAAYPRFIAEAIRSLQGDGLAALGATASGG